MYTINYLITKYLVFYIMAWNQLEVVFLRKQSMEMTNSGLDTGNYTECKPLGPKKYIGIRSRQVSV